MAVLPLFAVSVAVPYFAEVEVLPVPVLSDEADCGMSDWLPKAEQIFHSLRLQPMSSGFPPTVPGSHVQDLRVDEVLLTQRDSAAAIVAAPALPLPAFPLAAMLVAEVDVHAVLPASASLPVHLIVAGHFQPAVKFSPVPACNYIATPVYI